jgi:hypothetical protein
MLTLLSSPKNIKSAPREKRQPRLILRTKFKIYKSEFRRNHFLLFFFLPAPLPGFFADPFLPEPLRDVAFLFFVLFLPDFFAGPFFTALLWSAAFLFLPAAEVLLTFFAALVRDLEPFLEGGVAFRADDFEGFDPLRLEDWAWDVFLPACFFEAVRECLLDRLLASCLPDRFLASFLLERPFADAVRDLDFFFEDFPYFDFLPLPLLELFSQP